MPVAAAKEKYERMVDVDFDDDKNDGERQDGDRAGWTILYFMLLISDYFSFVRLLFVRHKG